MPLVGIGVDDLDLAIDDVNETIGRLPRPGEKAARGVNHLPACLTQGRHMGGGQGSALHLAQIVADGFHG